MSTAAPAAENPGPAEVVPRWDDLFPFGYRDIAPMHRELSHITATDIEGFVAVRRDGASTDMLKVLYDARMNVGSAEEPLPVSLADWHHFEGRLSDPHTTLLYHFGQLYGTHLSSARYRHKTGERLQPSDPHAYTAAMTALEASCQQIPADAQTTWDQQNWRELNFLGTNKLGILCALLSDRVAEQFAELAGQPLPDDHDALEAFYMGLVDASVFYNSYARYAHSRLPMQRFVDDGYLANPFSPGPLPLSAEELTALLSEQYPLAEASEPFEIHLPSGQDIDEFVFELWHNGETGYDWFAVESDDDFSHEVYDLLARKHITQVGPNKFRRTYRIDMALHRIEGLSPEDYASAMLVHMGAVTLRELLDGGSDSIGFKVADVLHGTLVRGLNREIPANQFGQTFTGFLSGFFAARRHERDSGFGDPIAARRISEN